MKLSYASRVVDPFLSWVLFFTPAGSNRFSGMNRTSYYIPRIRSLYRSIFFSLISFVVVYSNGLPYHHTSFPIRIVANPPQDMYDQLCLYEYSDQTRQRTLLKTDVSHHQWFIESLWANPSVGSCGTNPDAYDLSSSLPSLLVDAFLRTDICNTQYPASSAIGCL